MDLMHGSSRQGASTIAQLLVVPQLHTWAEQDLVSIKLLSISDWEAVLYAWGQQQLELGSWRGLLAGKAMPQRPRIWLETKAELAYPISTWWMDQYAGKEGTQKCSEPFLCCALGLSLGADVSKHSLHKLLLILWRAQWLRCGCGGYQPPSE